MVTAPEGKRGWRISSPFFPEMLLGTVAAGSHVLRAPIPTWTWSKIQVINCRFSRQAITRKLPPHSVQSSLLMA